MGPHKGNLFWQINGDGQIKLFWLLVTNNSARTWNVVNSACLWVLPGRIQRKLSIAKAWHCMRVSKEFKRSPVAQASPPTCFHLPHSPTSIETFFFLTFLPIQRKDREEQTMNLLSRFESRLNSALKKRDPKRTGTGDADDSEDTTGPSTDPSAWWVNFLSFVCYLQYPEARTWQPTYLLFCTYGLNRHHQWK